MFLPLKDHNPTRGTPVVTIALIAINVLVWFVELAQGPQLGLFVARWGAVPYELTHFTDLVGSTDGGIIQMPGPSPLWITAFTSMFLHGGWMHLLFNMLYLWIFGNNIEEFLGRLRYLLFYLGCGLAGLATHLLLHADSTVPVVGASAAISGILGAYLVLYPGARVTTLVFLIFFVTFIEVPALVLLGFWILMQVFAGVSSLGMRAVGTAHWAHIGGFAAGYIAMRFWLGTGRLEENRARQMQWREALDPPNRQDGSDLPPRQDEANFATPPPPPGARRRATGDPISRFLQQHEKRDPDKRD